MLVEACSNQLVRRVYNVKLCQKLVDNAYMRTVLVVL